MSILKYYKVDSDGKIKRLRRECPTAECGAGVFVSLVIFPLSFTLSHHDISLVPRWRSTMTANTAASVA
jgi:hypothetical protein